MAKEVKKKASLKERMKKKKEELKTKGQKGNVLFIKEGTLRVRLLPVGADNDIIAEVTHFYLNEKLRGFFSPSTFCEPCPGIEAYNDLKKSKDETDQDLAKKLSPKQAYLMPVLVYEDEKGKKIDKEKSEKLMKITGGLYQTIIDLYLDDDEWGDMTDPKNGYDLKITRTGKGKNDTEYSVAPCKNTPLPKEYAKKTYDLEKMVKAEIESYDVIQDKVSEFLGIDDDDKPKKKKDKKGKSKDKDKKEDKKPSKKEKPSKDKDKKKKSDDDFSAKPKKKKPKK